MTASSYADRRREGLAITGLGLVTSVAVGAVPSCAAARVQMSRPTELELEVQGMGGEREPIKGHSVRGTTDGYVGAGRLLRMLTRALDDLQATSSAFDGADTALLLHLGDHFYDAVAESDDPTLDRGQIFADQAEEVEGAWEAEEERLQTVVLRGIARRLGVPPAASTLTRGGAGALAETFSRAALLLRQGTVNRCVVGAADSLLAPSSLLKLEHLDLLKTPETPTGFAPGEAAGFVVLEGTRASGERLGSLTGIGFAHDPIHRFSGQPPTGRGSCDAVNECLHGLGRPAQVGSLIVNLSGDDYRPADLAHGLIRLKAEGLGLDGAPLWCPAVSFGETGAAASMVSIAIALQSFARGYAPDRDVLTLGISDDGGRGAIVVSKT